VVGTTDGLVVVGVALGAGFADELEPQATVAVSAVPRTSAETTRERAGPRSTSTLRPDCTEFCSDYAALQH
jgi:hypothetical protein